MKRIGFVAGIVVFVGVLALPLPNTFVETARALQQGTDPLILASSMQRMSALVLLMVVWWLTEAVPLPATALLPPILMPLLVDANLGFTLKGVLAHYFSPVIGLFLGGFLLAITMQKWKLDRRFTLWIMSRDEIATKPRMIVLGMMIATGFVSMWISNTATTAMMLPLALGLVGIMRKHDESSSFGTALMLGIAWSATIGGMGTIVGTPTNGVGLGIIATMLGEERSISFADWMLVGVPIVVVLLPLAWLVLTFAHPPGISFSGEGAERIREERRALGRLSRGERVTIALFCTAVTLWVTSPLWESAVPMVDEYTIGLGCGVASLLIPLDIRKGSFLLDWQDAKGIEWGTLILFGGGIALSEGLLKTGLAHWMAHSVVSLIGDPHPVVLLICMVVFINFLSEITSNVAVASMMVPIVVSIGLGAGQNALLLAVGATIASSLGFMMPVASPPNALVYGTGTIPFGTMVKTGFIMNLISCAVAVVVVEFLGNRWLGLFD